MRIDYSEPKKSCSSPQPGQARPRKEPSGAGMMTLFVIAIISLCIGFGSGWMFSQRAAKKGFKAAMEQQSLENSPRQDVIQVPVKATQPQIAASSQAVALPLPSVPGDSLQSSTVSGAQASKDQQLGFYKNLPSGQKNTALGSGINSKDDKPGRQPLQASIPGNVSGAASVPVDVNAQKVAVPAAALKPAPWAGKTRFTVQAASYSLKSEAEALRSNLASKGFNVWIAESNLADKGVWYRVRVGKQIDQDAARELAKKLGKGAIVIPDSE